MFFAGQAMRFDAAKDIPSLRGKVILVTGANHGLGGQSVLEFARHQPALLWLACRSADKANAAAGEIRRQVPGATIRPLELDLASFDSVWGAAQKVLSETDRLDILMLNAGIMGAPPGLTKDGYEIQFGTNHMGHALLTKLLLPVLSHTAAMGPRADVRIVSLASYGHKSVPKGAFRFDALKNRAESFGAYERYYQSKLANVLWARQLAKEHPEFTVASVHPGVVQTNLMEGATATPLHLKVLVKVGYKLLAPVGQGVRNQLWASVSRNVKSGEYYEPVGVAGLASEDGRDDALAKRLWDWTEAELERALYSVN